MPVNVTLLFSREQYIAAAEAYFAGSSGASPRGLIPECAPWHQCSSAAGTKRYGEGSKGTSGSSRHAIAKRTYKAYRDLLASSRWQKAAHAGAQPQRLLWASTGTKDPKASDVLYIQALAAPDTINTIPEKTLFAFADHGASVRSCRRMAAMPRV